MATYLCTPLRVPMQSDNSLQYSPAAGSQQRKAVILKSARGSHCNLRSRTNRVRNSALPSGQLRNRRDMGSKNTVLPLRSMWISSHPLIAYWRLSGRAPPSWRCPLIGKRIRAEAYRGTENPNRRPFDLRPALRPSWLYLARTKVTFVTNGFCGFEPQLPSVIAELALASLMTPTTSLRTHGQHPCHPMDTRHRPGADG